MPQGKDSGQAKVWTVFVDDNFHYMDESERYEFGSYERYEDAEAACREIVDRFLADQLDRNASSLYEIYCGFGEDPFIIGPDTGRKFHAWAYAKYRCDELCPPAAPQP